ncbi:phosphohydrolase [Lysinibacillus sphaericus]|uniref:HD domain-containing protein n=1 Tax=Lysinibacillus sphaericus TaxID=1421 RepID=UPI0018CDB1A7|nr:HD domain-containing protein [Lysinibacillus sphaericus]MBG9453086.1 phosphohydrolase [Lysinibacillus sphaericus]MBG9477621.1 phosphohydrolase [Lysinibacillus sphaericus]MBG9594352.1 phosphohydrolase [Lysinibacillus sphaericus]
MNNLMDKVRGIYEQFDASHDFQHIERVYQNALAILETESEADAEVVKIAVLLHDVSDKKYTESKEQENKLIAELPLSEDKKQHIRDCIEQVSFNGGNELEATSLEAKIARDADRLDAIGAIGIARTFAFGGAKGRKLYDKEENARMDMTEDEYRSKNTSSVTHFYEKLLLLKDLMITEKGKQMAEERHQFMVQFLEQLQNEIGE